MLDQSKFEILIEHPNMVLIDKKAPVDLKLMVLAAVQAYRYGNKSVDQVLNQFGAKWRHLLEAHKD